LFAGPEKAIRYFEGPEDAISCKRWANLAYRGDGKKNAYSVRLGGVMMDRRD
jgi:hypothetical protein